MSVAFAINSAVHGTTQMTPGKLVFGRDVMFHATYFTNWEHMRWRKKNKIEYNNTL